MKVLLHLEKTPVFMIVSCDISKQRQRIVVTYWNEGPSMVTRVLVAILGLNVH